FNGNPVIASNNECRDPNLYWNEQTKEWNLYLVSALTYEVWFYTSKDLKHWTKASAFGNHGSKGGVWECPDLMKLPVRDRKGMEKYMLIVNINPGGPFGGSATQYFVGNWDGKTFTCDSPAETEKWMDFGKDHYATVSWANAPKGRNTVIAWMSNWQYATVVPTMQFRSANSLPRDLDLFTGDDKELYVGVKPSPEVDALRGEKVVANTFTAGKTASSFSLPKDGLCEIDLTSAVSSAKKLILTLTNGKGEKVVMTYDTADKTFAMDRTKSGIVNFSADFPAVTKAPLLQPKAMTKSASMRIFIDRSSIEVFEGEGRFAMTNLVFPTEPYTTLTVEAEGKAKTNLTVFALSNIY
ncbi:MAG: glycoside hydrolase family 32 protein, partial [Bacteroidaceae bacterium]|nr:glycoside hydrolase family 32 protein [Bacteroidaceae bacterium]